LAKTDDVLLALSRTIPEFIRSVGFFQYEGKTYRLVDNFASVQHMKCSVCGNYPIFDVSVIRSENGDRLNVCNSCIDRITDQNVSIWFKSYRKKRENIIENRKYIDGLLSILTAYERDELSFRISSEDVEKLRKTFVQMCNGLNLRTEQKQLAECYIRYRAELLVAAKRIEERH
jgi:protein-arginine kinase activator protein McsA